MASIKIKLAKNNNFNDKMLILTNFVFIVGDFNL